MGTTPMLLAGREALDVAAADTFQAQWKVLYESCPWATACQHPDFVLPWYTLYQSHFVPVLVVERGANGVLAGLLPLALHADGKRLCGAGERQAEYQGWLLAPGADARFIVRAVRLLQARFAHADLCLKYLPAGISLGGFDETRKLGTNCVWRRHRRPLMQVDAAAMARQRSKKNHRQNFNRLGRIGEVRFGRVSSQEQFARVLGDICNQVDFRHAALYRTMPFAGDAAKRLFCLELHRRGLLHATILTVGQDIAAAHLGLLSAGRAVHLGINSHDPAWAAHSPGNLLLAMLGVHLAHEKLPLLDLTPGGDGYKEHFASEHDVVLELLIYSNTARRWRAQALRSAADFLKQRLRKAGIDSTDARAWLMHLRERSWPGGRRWLDKLRPASAHSVLRHAGLQHPGANDLPIARNRLADVLSFDAHGSSARYNAFLARVMKRMERSHHLYTLVQDGRLAMACWASTEVEQDGAQDGAQPAQAAAAVPPGAVVLSDLYLHRDYERSALVQGFIDGVVGALKNTAADQVVYRGVVNAGRRATLERCGFVDASGVRGSQTGGGLPGMSTKEP